MMSSIKSLVLISLITFSQCFGAFTFSFYPQLFSNNLPIAPSEVISKKEVPIFDKVCGVALDFMGTLSIEQISKNETEMLVITADDNLLPECKTTFNDGILTISPKRQGISINGNYTLRYTLKIKSLDTINNITLSGSGSINIKNLKSGNLIISLNGSGEINIENLTCSTLEEKISGSGEINIKFGKADTQNISINGSGGVSTEQLKGNGAYIKINGSGTACVNIANNKIAGSIVGSGCVTNDGKVVLIHANSPSTAAGE
ncbi:MAG: DUF2807 domain-containing protein [Candidatus Babeliales bacterium]